MFGLGFGEMLIIGFVAMLFFGPKRLPDLGSSLGKSIRNFKKGLSETEQTEETPKAVIPAPQDQDQNRK